MSTLMINSPQKILQKDLFRLSSVLWSGLNGNTINPDIEKAIIQAVIYDNQNYEMTAEEILMQAVDKYFEVIPEHVLETTISSYKNEFIKHENEGRISYSLSKQRQEAIDLKEASSMVCLAQRFVEYAPEYNQTIVTDALEKYFYDLTTTNLNAYRLIFQSSLISISDALKEFDISVDTNEYEDIELQIVNSFVNWDDPCKDDLILDIVLCGLEFCLHCAGDKENFFIENGLSGYKLYLDTNIIFRALGINGLGRQTLIKTFLKKCVNAKVTITILSFTKTEFFNTITSYIEQIAKFERGRIYPGAFAAMSDYSVFDYYNDWIETRPDSTLAYFTAFISSQYEFLVKEFGIITEPNTSELQVFNHFEDSERKTIIIYGNQITQVKREWKDGELYFNYDEDYYASTNLHDAILARYAEKQIEDNSNIRIAIISADKSFRYWDFRREKNHSPILMYPSHFLTLLIKVVGRASDDAKCFAKFVNLKTRSKKMNPNQANAVISGISTITEDIKKQQILVSAILNDNFQFLISNNISDVALYERAKLFSQNYLKEELAGIQEKNKDLEEQIIQQKDEISKMHGEMDSNSFDKQQVEQQFFEEKQCRKLLEKQLARQFTQNAFRKKVYWLPLLFILMVILLAVCAALTFLYTDWRYNLVFRTLMQIKSIAFGEAIWGNIIYGYLCALPIIAYKLYKKWWFNFFSHKDKEAIRDKLIDKYLADNINKIDSR